MALTVKVAGVPLHVSVPTGCAVIDTGEFTVSVATFDTRFGVHVPLNTTLYCVPFNAADGVRFNVGLVAPAIFVKVVPLFVLTCH